MEEVTIAAGSNLGERQDYLKQASAFLKSISEGGFIKSSVWESEPVGGALYPFYNSAVRISTSVGPVVLLKKLKEFEQKCGREKNPERWGPRVLDLDIIRFGNLVIDTENLIIPHPEYSRRLFVLLPMLEVDPDWIDPATRRSLSEMIIEAPEMEIRKTETDW